MLLCLMGSTPSSPGWGDTPSSHGRGGRYPTQSWLGVPHLVLAGGVPHTVLARGYPGIPPHPDLGWDTPWDGVPPCQLDGVPLPGPGMGNPPIQTWDGVPPCQLDGVSPHPSGLGVPPVSWMGYPPCLDLGWGTPSHPDLGWGTPHRGVD